MASLATFSGVAFMSINPVGNLDAIPSHPVEPGLRPAAVSASPNANDVSPDLRTSPKRAATPTQDSTQLSDLPQDEVQVQRDNQSNGEIVIKYLDHHGEVILQVPSSELLRLARSIRQDLEKSGQNAVGQTEPLRGKEEGR